MDHQVHELAKEVVDSITEVFGEHLILCSCIVCGIGMLVSKMLIRKITALHEKEA